VSLFHQLAFPWVFEEVEAIPDLIISPMPFRRFIYFWKGKSSPLHKQCQTPLGSAINLPFGGFCTPMNQTCIPLKIEMHEHTMKSDFLGETVAGCNQTWTG